ncbi:MAG: Unknown protein [uncultured Aureispira sp.]|uniref:Uncharacterized protein n=1 Tax=uncultured Aureispira sp. TaxID=1331704 RepID=A0A6S6UK53_9BACT|nr:MAG: Unknown protein [uncultured Aureispira sp.]
MKTKVQIDLNLTQRSTKNSPVQVNSWVNKALDSKNKINSPRESDSGRKLQLNMTFCKSILNRR